MTSNNINSFNSNPSTSRQSDTSETSNSIAITGISKTRKNRGRGQRGKALRSNPCNSVGYLRSCPPRTIRQANKLKCHKRISRIFKNPKFEYSPDWKPNDLYCGICNTTTTGKRQLAQHFKSIKHKNGVWACTPKYCDPCGVYCGFDTEQLWKVHIVSRRHTTKISSYPIRKQVPGEYGFTN